MLGQGAGSISASDLGSGMTIDLCLTAEELEPIWQHVARTGFVLRCAFARFAVQCLGHRTREQKMGRESLIDRVAAMSDQSKGLAPLHLVEHGDLALCFVTRLLYLISR